MRILDSVTQVASLLSLADKSGEPDVSTSEPSLPVDLLSENLADKLITSKSFGWCNPSTPSTSQVVTLAGPVPKSSHRLETFSP